MNAKCGSRIALTALAGLGAALVFSGFRTDFLTGKKILERHLERHQVKTRAERIKMVTLDRRGNVTTREVLRLTKNRDDGSKSSLLRFTAPAEVKGVSLLSNQVQGKTDTQFIFQPGLGQVRKILGNGRKGYFMGPDFAYEDLLLEDTDSFKYGQELDATVDGVRCFHLRALPQAEDDARSSNYSRRMLWVSKKDYRVLKVELYTKQGKLMKSLEFSDFRDVGGETGGQHPFRAKMTHHLRETQSLLVTTHASYNQPLDDRFFTATVLEAWGADEDAAIEAALK